MFLELVSNSLTSLGSSVSISGDTLYESFDGKVREARDDRRGCLRGRIQMSKQGNGGEGRDKEIR